MSKSLVGKLAFLGRYPTVWIFLAMGLGVAFGKFHPQVVTTLTSWPVDSTSIPIAVGDPEGETT